jgi:thiol-disulfide isomerase/thioredoxin
MWIVLGVVVLLGVVAIIASRSGSDNKSSSSNIEENRPVTVTGAALPDYQSPTGDTAVGKVAPEVKGQSFDGTPVSITNDGNGKVVMFVAHWCPHCQKEVPVITSYLQGTQPPAGVKLVAVSTSVNSAAPNYPPSAWLERENWPVPTIADDKDQTAAKAYGLTSFPYFVAVDKDGKVVARNSGELSTQEFLALMQKAAGTAPSGT